MAIVHMLVDAPDCAGPLNDGEALLSALRAAAAAVGATECGCAQVLYVPHGVTAVLFLAESHMLISTWPERGLALVDILLCRESVDSGKAWNTLAAVLKPGSPIRATVVDRTA